MSNSLKTENFSPAALIFYSENTIIRNVKLCAAKERSMQNFSFKTNGVCASYVNFSVDGQKISGVSFLGGCAGNSAGLAKLVEGMDVDAVIEKLQGVRCGSRPTSCPDQLAKALVKAKNAAGP